MASKIQSDRPADWQWSCGLCKKDHSLKSCQRFLNASADERYDVVILKGYCLNCLARSHLAKFCKNEYGCRVCTKRHNTLLHDAPQLKKPLDPKPLKSAEKPHKIPPTKSQTTQTTQNDPFMWPNVFVPTATIRIAAKEKTDDWSYIRVMISQNISTSRIAKSSVKRLGLLKTEIQSQQFAIVNMRARNSRNKFHQQILAYITDELPRRPYIAPIKDNPFEEFSEDTLADMDPRSNTQIEMELGSDVYPLLRRDGAINLEMGKVVAQKTAVGYTFVGPTTKLY